MSERTDQPGRTREQREFQLSITGGQNKMAARWKEEQKVNAGADEAAAVG